MATSTWFGGYGRYGAARLWDPRGVPGAGDTAVIDGGEVVARRQDIAAPVVLGGLDAGSQPVLDLRNSSVSRLTMPADLPQQPYTTTQSPPEYGTARVFGHSSIGSLDIGAYANMVRAPDPYGHGDLTARDNLTIALNGSATLDTAFDVKDGSTLTINGGEASSFNAADSTIEGGRVVVNAPLAGYGTIFMTNGAVEYYGAAQTGTLELGGSVGAGETIDIRMGHLLIDQPMAFAGLIDIRAQENAGQYQSYGAQEVTLGGLSATAYSFDDASHTMTLWNGADAVDQVHFTPDIVAASFGPGYSGNIGVAQLDGGGVFLRGQYSGFPTGAVEIPMLASQA